MNRLVEIIANAIRGFLIGMAELVPGISGGTIALVVGIYERALQAASDILDTFKALFTDPKTFGQKFRQWDWILLLPIGVAMLFAVFSMSGVLSNFVTNYPEVSRALFLGMVAMSIMVPMRMVYQPDLKSKPWVWAFFVVAAIITFFGTGFTAAPQENPSLLVIFAAAAFAIIALVLPGVSGSFLLLALGLYAPVMESISNREWSVIGVFALGALTGLVLFVRILNWLINEHRTVTLITMSGLMLGSLRALWPFQDANANLLPVANWSVFGWTLLGAAIVALTIWLETRLPHSSGSTIHDEQAPAAQ